MFFSRVTDIRVALTKGNQRGEEMRQAPLNSIGPVTSAVSIPRDS
jgi:hypothetical protein